MKTTIEARKQKAMELLKKLDIYKPYINGFVNENRVCFYEQYAGYWVDQEPEIEQKMREIEQKHNCTVYAITHEYLEFGDVAVKSWGGGLCRVGQTQLPILEKHKENLK